MDPSKVMTYEETGLNPLIVFMNNQFEPFEMDELEGYIEVTATMLDIHFKDGKLQFE